jgi:adenine-specific DNA-methyltransferase
MRLQEVEVPGRRRSDEPTRVIPVADYEHPLARRTNNPPVGLAHLDRDETPVRILSYDPHLDPQLVWSGKRERAEVIVPAPSIHVHEELSAEKIIGSVRRQRTQQPLFDIDQLDPAKAVEFYRHELNWSNRMILGDSLTVMTSLLERERLGGKVQCIYFDPPYGVNYKSNFQPSVSTTDVSEDDSGLSREPEMIQAYRDTWELGVHSYLSYLRDRLVAARELLTDSGSVFVQISDDHAHLVRVLLDEVFGAHNFVSQISFLKTSSSTGRNLGTVTDYLIWYARDIEHVKYRQLYRPRELADPGAKPYNKLLLSDGQVRPLSESERYGLEELPEGARVFRLDNLRSQSIGRKKGPGAASWFEVELNGQTYTPGPTSRWKTNEEGMERLRAAGRLRASGSSLNYVRFVDDFSGVALTNSWSDTIVSGFADSKRYVVQTSPNIARCLAMATDPGDLVLDPTCGGGTTAYVCEQYGRRWITVDTSRVALAVARERLLTARYDYYQLAKPDRDVDGGLKYEAQLRTTLGQIAKAEEPEVVVLYGRPLIDKTKVRVSGPFTVEALSRYAVNPLDEPQSANTGISPSPDHIPLLLDALRTQGLPRPGSAPLPIEGLSEIAAAGPLQAEGITTLGNRKARFAVSLGPQFGAITMAQVSDALRSSIGFDLVVFAGFAVDAEAQERLATGKVGGTDVALLLSNPDLLVGDLLKNTSTSQTFRLYASPDVRVESTADGIRVHVEGLDSFDAATGEITSYGRTGVQAWFLDDDYDGAVFQVAQAFFPVTEGWDKLRQALRGTVDADLVAELHGWTSLPFEPGEHQRVAVRVVANDGNAAEVTRDLPTGSGSS